jgi:hypothetical protein
MSMQLDEYWTPKAHEIVQIRAKYGCGYHFTLPWGTIAMIFSSPDGVGCWGSFISMPKPILVCNKLIGILVLIIATANFLGRSFGGCVLVFGIGTPFRASTHGRPRSFVASGDSRFPQP